MAVDGCITYEDFGAVGDGVADDLPAICAAHEAANAKGLPVVARGDATYHLGRRALTAVIATDVDWSTARFIIDDRDLEDHTQGLFVVRSLQDETTLPIERIERDQRHLDHHPETACFVRVEDDQQRRYIRYGLNQNAGAVQHDSFILHPDGTIEGDIDWDYPRLSTVMVKPIDEATLTVRGGVFTTIANRWRQEQGYNYHKRGIQITRSNTVIEGLTHYVVGETDVGHPYGGFLDARNAARITFRDCFVTPHKIYQTIAAAGKPVSMGSYDLHANDIVDFRMVGCRQNHILDRTRWGIIGSNFCKNITLEDCVLSRMDTHMGVSGHYTIRNCTLGYMGLNAIGRGQLRIEGSTLYGPSIVSFRGDYGSTWDGEVAVVDSTWTPRCGDECWPTLIHGGHNGNHDFGYPCSLPTSVTLERVHINDAKTPADYTGAWIFQDPDREVEGERRVPYRLTESMTLRGVTTASGKPLQVSPNAEFAQAVTVKVEPEPVGRPINEPHRHG